MFRDARNTIVDRSTFWDIGGDHITIHNNSPGARLCSVIAQPSVLFAYANTTNAEDEFRKLIDRLNPVNYEDDYVKGRESRLLGTCNWVLEDEIMKSWLQSSSAEGDPSDSPYIWIHGKPGSGKTIIVSAIIQQVLTQANPQSVHDQLNLYFFCDNKTSDDSRASASSMRAFLVQALMHWKDATGCHELIRDINAIFHPNEKLAPSFVQLSDAFQRVIRQISCVRIIVDALDECQDRKLILTLLKDLMASFRKTLRVLIVSRVEVDIRECALPPTWKHIAVTCDGVSHNNNADIELYVSKQVLHLEVGDLQLKQRIKDRVLQRADGMFLYVHLTMDHLRSLRHSSIQDLEQALGSLPLGMHAVCTAYFRELARRAENYPDGRSLTDSLTVRALRWLMCAKRPMRLEELAAAIALEPNHTKLESLRILNDSKALISELLGAIVAIRCPDPDDHVNQSDGSTSGLIVTLIHSTVKDFLQTPSLSRFHDSEPACAFLMDSQLANSKIATQCLSYLALPNVFRRWIIHLDDARFNSDLPLVQYAGEYWLDHLVDAQAAGERELGLRQALVQFIYSASMRVVLSAHSMSSSLPDIRKRISGRIQNRTLLDSCFALRDTTNAIDDLITSLSTQISSSPWVVVRRKYMKFKLRKYLAFQQNPDSVPRPLAAALSQITRTRLVDTGKQLSSAAADLLPIANRLRYAAVALSSPASADLEAAAGADARHIVVAHAALIQAIEVFVALPCLASIPSTIFSYDKVFQTHRSDPNPRRFTWASLKGNRKSSSIRAHRGNDWIIAFSTSVDFWDSESPPLNLYASLPFYVVGGWFTTGNPVVSVFSMYIPFRMVANTPLYSFQHRVRGLRGGSGIRLSIAMQTIGYFLRNIWYNDYQIYLSMSHITIIIVMEMLLSRFFGPPTSPARLIAFGSVARGLRLSQSPMPFATLLQTTSSWVTLPPTLRDASELQLPIWECIRIACHWFAYLIVFRFAIQTMLRNFILCFTLANYADLVLSLFLEATRVTEWSLIRLFELAKVCNALEILITLALDPTGLTEIIQRLNDFRENLESLLSRISNLLNQDRSDVLGNLLPNSKGAGHVVAETDDARLGILSSSSRPSVGQEFFEGIQDLLNQWNARDLGHLCQVLKDVDISEYEWSERAAKRESIKHALDQAEHAKRYFSTLHEHLGNLRGVLDNYRKSLSELQEHQVEGNE